MHRAWSAPVSATQKLEALEKPPGLILSAIKLPPGHNVTALSVLSGEDILETMVENRRHKPSWNYGSRLSESELTLSPGLHTN